MLLFQSGSTDYRDKEFGGRAVEGRAQKVSSEMAVSSVFSFLFYRRECADSLYSIR